MSVVEDGGRLRDIITGLPGQGDHQADEMVFKDGFLYLSIGTATNSGVVGPDNAVFGWLTDPAKRDVHDVPCRAVVGGSAPPAVRRALTLCERRQVDGTDNPLEGPLGSVRRRGHVRQRDEPAARRRRTTAGSERCRRRRWR